MQGMGIEALCPKPATSRKLRGRGQTTPRYLLRNLPNVEANHVCAMDPTAAFAGAGVRIPMRHGFVYLVGLIDVSTQRVREQKLCAMLETHQAVEIVEQAIAKFVSPEIVNTDQGNLSTALEFTETIGKRGIKLSMYGIGVWRDNVFIERFWRTLKYERIYKRAYDTVSEVRADNTEYIAWYNDRRPHTGLNDRTPQRAYDQS